MTGVAQVKNDELAEYFEESELYMNTSIRLADLITSNDTGIRSCFELDGKLKQTANDKCVTAGYPCAHFVKCGLGTINRCFAP
jgi:hypothetical protein